MTSQSPPPHDNFAETPEPEDPYDFTEWVYDEELEGYVRRSKAEG